MQSTHEREGQSQQNLEVVSYSLFVKNSIEKGIVDIKLMNLSIMRNHNGKD
jgi:hypothetical protein